MAAPAAAPATLPSWITLGQIFVAIGAIVIFIGFIFGALAASNLGTSSTNLGNASNVQADYEAFFVITGIGILIAMGGWGFHSIWPKFKARPRPVVTYTAPAAAPAVAAAPAPPPVAAPAAPLCARCGKPTTYIAQYGRYYCYADNLYV